VRAEIVAIGTELLLGEHVDTNSTWISARLAEVGVDVFRHVTVGDNIERMRAVLTDAAGRADAVVVTGGLGPTQDDLTRVAVAQVAGVELERRHDLAQRIADYFARGGRSMPERNLVQADLPAGARVIPPAGTAPGFAVDVGDAVVYCLPGVPSEMEQMFTASVLPDLIERGGLATTLSRLVRTAGIAESAVAELCAPLVGRLDAAGNPTIAFLASGGQTRVRVTAKAPSREAAAAALDPVVDELVGLLGASVVGLDGEDIEHAVARRLGRLGWTLAVAESVTGGGVSARLTGVPGASRWFRGGLVVYATDMKMTLAGVDPQILDRHGPVAEETAGALAVGAAERLGADVGLGVVGVAGPDPQDGVPVGTVCVGVRLPAVGVRTRTVRLPGRGRHELQRFAVTAGIEYLRRRLAEAVGGP
jgi:nicotinamide-nucleotide amidase